MMKIPLAFVPALVLLGQGQETISHPAVANQALTAIKVFPSTQSLVQGFSMPYIVYYRAPVFTSAGTVTPAVSGVPEGCDVIIHACEPADQ